MQPNLGSQVSGAEPPRSFLLDASVMDFHEDQQIIREDVKQNRVVFNFPSGVNKLDLLEECRALTMIDDFDMMFDITMQMLVDKDLEIYIKNLDGKPILQTSLHVTDRYQNLRGDNFIDEYPVVVTWLVSFIGELLLKKFPVPGKPVSAPPQVPAKAGAKLWKPKGQA
jgi:hypothetical protein